MTHEELYIENRELRVLIGDMIVMLAVIGNYPGVPDNLKGRIVELLAEITKVLTDHRGAHAIPPEGRQK